MDVKEFEIPVPWGHVSGTTSGDERDPIVLVIHGIWDNSAAYYRLIPLLPKTFYYVMIDLPGHGKSSHFPQYRPVYFIDYLVAYKYIMDYFNRKPYRMLVHSFSSHLALIFTQLYPNYTERIIVLDAVSVYPISVQNFKRTVTNKIDNTIRFHKKIAQGLQQPSYTYEECLEKQLNQRIYSGLTKEAGEALLSRWLISVGDNKFKFSLDARAKFYINMIYGMESLVDLIKMYPITCPILYIIAKDSIPAVDYFKQYINVMKKNNKHCYIVKVNGNHDVHICNPSIIAPLITNFLLYKCSKL